jgi:hypothetical protein
MGDSPGFVDLIARLRALLDAEYRRGQADAARRIIDAAQAEVSPSTLHSDKPEPSAMAPSSALRRRAPYASNGIGRRHRVSPGVPDALITRVLIAQREEGASSRLIEELAESDEEKMVSQSGIRFALDRGKAAGRYRNASGRWYLVTEGEKN